VNYYQLVHDLTGLEIGGHPIVRDYHFLGKDDHVLTDGSPSDDLIFAPIIVLFEEGPLNLGGTTMFFKEVEIWHVSKVGRC
jgi:hypothetical protein